MENWFWLTQNLGIVASTIIVFGEENCFCKAEPNMWQIAFFQFWGCRSDSWLGKSWTKQALIKYSSVDMHIQCGSINICTSSLQKKCNHIIKNDQKIR